MLGKMNSIKLDGNNNVIYQDVTISFEHFVERFSREKDERIEELRRAIADKEKLIDRSERLFNLELNELKEELAQARQEREKLEERLKEQIRQFEETDFSAASELYRQASTAFMEGRLDEAIELLDEAKLEAEEIKLAESRILKAQLLELKGSYQEAEKQYKRAVSIAPTFDHIYSYAEFKQKEGGMKKANKLYKKALDKLSKSDEAYHLKRAKTLHSLACTYNNINDREQGESYFVKALELYNSLAKEAPGKYQSIIAAIHSGMGHMYQHQREFSKAEESFKETLRINKSLTTGDYISNNSATARSMADLGRLYLLINRDNEAGEYMNGALAKLKEFAQPDIDRFLPEISTVIRDIGTFYQKTGRYKEAQECYITAAQMTEDLLLTRPALYLYDHLQNINYLGAIYLSIGSSKEGEEILNKALIICDNWPGKVSEKVMSARAQILANLTFVYCKEERTDEMEMAALEAVTIMQKLVAKNPDLYLENTAKALNTLGVVYYKQARYNEAEKAYKAAIEIFEVLAEQLPLHFLPFIPPTLMNIAELHKIQKSYELAEKYSLQALEIEGRLLKEGNSMRVDSLTGILKELAIICESLKRVDEAEEYYKNIHNIKKDLAQKGSLYHIFDFCESLLDCALFFSRQNGRKKERDYLLNEAISILEQLPDDHRAREYLEFARRIKTGNS